MARTVAYCALHYGSSYLAHAIRGVYPVVDSILISYTPKPSYGHGTDLVCPDSEFALRGIVRANDPDYKIEWLTRQWNGEGEHRDGTIAMMGPYGPEDVVVVFDSDEIWDTDALRAAIGEARRIDNKNFLVPFLHFFKSFGWVCSDGQRPVRLIKPACSGSRSLDTIRPVFHFGYAISFEAMAFKWSCHGHKSELRPGWLERYRNWKPGEVDMHPVNINNFWHPEPFPRQALPSVLHDHPFFGRELIE